MRKGFRGKDKPVLMAHLLPPFLQIAEASSAKGGRSQKTLNEGISLVFKAILPPPLFKGRVGVGLMDALITAQKIYRAEFFSLRKRILEPPTRVTPIRMTKE